MKQSIKKYLSLLLAVLLALYAGFAAAEAQPEAAEELFGYPWVNTQVAGNLPEAAPEIRDDLYLAVNYDDIAKHQGPISVFAPIATSTAEISSAVTAILKDESNTGADLDQMRIFWEQAADMESLHAAGFTPVMQYIERLEAAASIEEFNAVLTAEDFPFSPYLVMLAAPLSLKEENVTWIWPALSLSSDFMNGANYYTETAEDTDALLQKIAALPSSAYTQAMVMNLGLPQEAMGEAMLTIFNTEAGYVKEGYSELKASAADYGYISNAPHYFSLEELEQLCSRFPLAATLKKFGKDKSPTFVVPEPAWLSTLDGIWTDENLDTLKLLTRFKLLMETAPYLDPEPVNFVRNALGQPSMDAESNPWNACNQTETFGSLAGKLYAEKVLGVDVKETLTGMSRELIETYRDLINETAWLSDDSRALALEKLDHIVLNILEPDGGYTDFSGLKLTPASEGGTLFGSYLAIKAYLNEKDNERIGQPALGETPWRALNPTISNCFYDPYTNSISILPGFITSHILRQDTTEAQLYGSVGTVIAHELSHGFDYAGSQCDAYGRGNPILTEADRETFLAEVKKVEDYYNGITVLPGLNCKGASLRVENTADLAGMKTAVRAVAAKGLDLEAFFREYARIYVMVVPIQSMQSLYYMDTHSPNYIRVNVNAQMMDEFCEVFGVKEGDGMYVKPEDRLKVWGK